MLIAIQAVVVMDLAVSFGRVLSQPPPSQPIKPDPLVGKWEGRWSFGTGSNLHVGTFRLDFEEKNGHLQGRFVALTRTDKTTNPANKRLIGKPRIKKLPYHPESIRNVTRTLTDPPNYRFSADRYCWNVAVKENLMAGFRHNGQCSSVGVGAGTALIDVQANRVTSKKAVAERP